MYYYVFIFRELCKNLGHLRILILLSRVFIIHSTSHADMSAFFPSTKAAGEVTVGLKTALAV